MTSRSLVRFAIAVALAFGVSAVAREDAAATLRLVKVPATFSSPVFVTSARDGSNRLFVVERAGVIKVLQPGSTVPTVFLDISTVVTVGGERGLLGLTFHPQYSSNGRFFVYYSRLSDSASVIAEYGVSGNPDVADTTETPILAVPQLAAQHLAGMIEFGPDGFLYIALGDGSEPHRSQDIEDLHGKILRIDVDGTPPYTSPASNPFVGIAGADEVYAYGFRNPWRFSFDRLTGALYVGDVGQAAVEEVDVVTSGGNYGWYIWEGSSCTEFVPPAECVEGSYIFPETEYPHSPSRCSVTGGYVYRGTQGTVPLGTYLFADLCSGEILALQSGTVNVALQALALNITSFGEDEAGEVYVVGFGADSGLHRLIEVPQSTDRDFNVDDLPDILWRNTGTGGVAVWLLNGITLTGNGFPGGAGADWQIVGVGDFNGDGKGDILWRDNTGLVAIWFLDGTTMLGSGIVSTVGGGNWDIVRVADFNADGKADILWHNTITDIYAIWFLDGLTLLSSGTLQPNSPGPGWQVAGVGDLNGDGKADIVWRDPAGTVTTWLMSGTKRLQAGGLAAVTTDWHIERLADFNGDDTADILWRNDAGNVAVWLLNGTAFIEASLVAGTAGPDWHIAGAGDFNGDGKADILWRQDTGAISVWFMNGTVLTGTSGLGAAGTEWQIQ